MGGIVMASLKSIDRAFSKSHWKRLRRAVFLARGFGINAIGYEAADVSGRHSVKTCLREQLAKIAALIDVAIRRQPKFLGPLEKCRSEWECVR